MLCPLYSFKNFAHSETHGIWLNYLSPLPCHHLFDLLAKPLVVNFSSWLTLTLYSDPVIISGDANLRVHEPSIVVAWWLLYLHMYSQVTAFLPSHSPSLSCLLACHHQAVRNPTNGALLSFFFLPNETFLP